MAFPRSLSPGAETASFVSLVSKARPPSTGSGQAFDKLRQALGHPAGRADDAARRPCFSLKIAQNASFWPKKRLFEGVLFTTKTIDLSSALSGKRLIQEGLYLYPGLVRIPKKGVLAIFLFLYGTAGRVGAVSFLSICTVQDHCAPREGNSMQLLGANPEYLRLKNDSHCAHVVVY